MSTYNGERYLREQLDSIFAQSYHDLELLVRDDGSTDTTLDILKEYCSKYSNMSYYTGPNLRSARSFLDLLNKASDAEYYAFCDQDDYWMPDKLEVGIRNIRQYETAPALYFCQTQLVDKELKAKETAIIHPLLTFGESLVSQFVGGCAMIFNHKLREAVIAYTPEYLPMHDIWVYLVAQALGAKICFDSIPHILYRQHENNVVGQGKGRLAAWGKRLDRLSNDRGGRSHLAVELASGYASMMDDEHLNTLKKFLNGKKSLIGRIKLATDKKYRCFSDSTYKMFIISVLLNIY